MINLLERPISAFPYNNAIDATIGNKFTFTFSGDKLSKYKINIYNLVNNSSIYSGSEMSVSDIYRGDEVTVSVPSNTLTNGMSLYWDITMYQDAYDVFVTSGRTAKASSGSILYIGLNIKSVASGMKVFINNAFYTINSYDASTGKLTLSSSAGSIAIKTNYVIYSNYVVSHNFPFITRKTPTISISGISSPHKKRSISLTGNYSQADGSRIKYHRWRLYNGNSSNAITIADTGNVFSERLKFNFDGLIYNSTYYVELSGETQDGATFTTGLKPIVVSYTSPKLLSAPTVSIDYEKTALKIDLDGIDQYIAEDTGGNTFPSEGNRQYLHLTSGTVSVDVTKSKIKKDDFYLQMLSRIDVDSIGDVIRLDFEDGSYRKIVFDGTNLKLDKDGKKSLVLALRDSSQWCFTTEGIPESTSILYEWDDNATWDDTLCWTESAAIPNSFVFGLTADTCIIKEVTW